MALYSAELAESMADFAPFRGRSALLLGDRVQVYYDLQSGHFSLQKQGLVYAKADVVALQDVTFHVSESGRQRVIREKRKNVHAKVHGILNKPDYSTLESLLTAGYSEAAYNPYRQATFIDRASGLPLMSARTVVLCHRRIFYLPTT